MGLDLQIKLDDYTSLGLGLMEELKDVTNKILSEEDDETEKYTMVGPFNIRATLAPDVNDHRLVKWLFEEKELDKVVASVGSGIYVLIKKEIFEHLRPTTCLSNYLINYVVEMLCVREL